MSILLDPKRERFAQAVALGKSRQEAYLDAGYGKAGRARDMGARRIYDLSRRIADTPEICDRIAELLHERASIGIAAKDRAIEAVGISAARVFEEMKHLAFSDIGEILDFTGDTVRLRIAKDIPEAARRAIAAMKCKRYTEGKGEGAREVEIIEFKFWSKSDALEKLGRHLGLWTDPQATDRPKGWDDSELAKHIAAKQKGDGHLDA